MEHAVEFVVLSLARGSLYALVGLGFALVFGVGRVLNLFHGGFFLLGAYGAFVASDLLGGGTAAARAAPLLAAVATGLVGLAYYHGAIRPYSHDPLRLVVVGLTANVFAAELIRAIYGTRAAYVPPVASGGFKLSTTLVLRQEVVIVLATAALFPLLWAFLRLTRTGAAVRAAADDARGARLVGVEPQQVLGLTVAASAALAGLAGALAAPLRVVAPEMWTFALLKAFLVTLVGGLGSLPGCLLAAYGFGAIEVLATQQLGEGRAELVSTVVALLALAARPRGLCE